MTKNRTIMPSALLRSALLFSALLCFALLCFALWEHNALFPICQARQHKYFESFIAEDEDHCALSSAFCVFIEGGDALW